MDNLLDTQSEHQSQLRRERARSDEVCAAESREEIIESVFVGQVYRRQTKGYAVVVGAQEVIGSDAQIEKVSRRDARRVVIVISRSLRRNPHAQRAAIRISASAQPSRRRGESSAAKQADLRLLVRRQPERGRKIRHRSGDRAAVVTPTEGDVRLDLREAPKLILYLRGLLKSLVVINAKDASRQIRIEEEPAAFRRKVSRPRVPGGKESRDTFVVGKIDARREAVDLRQIPRDRKSDRRVQDHAEIVGVARTLPEIIDVDHDVFPDALLNSEVELMPPSGLERLGYGAAQGAGQSALAGRAGEDEVLVVWRLQAATVRGAQDGVGSIVMI